MEKKFGSLAVRKRPQTFEDVVEQSVVVDIMKNQLAQKSFKNVYLITGGSGIGKTTLARIFGNAINNGTGDIIEIDAASQNSVDNIRALVSSAKERALIGEYKCYVLDECVTGDTEILTDKGWKRFDTLDHTEKVAQYTDDGNIEFVVPNEFIELDYTGKMYKVAVGEKATFNMSPNHVQPLYYLQSKKIKENYIEDTHFGGQNCFIRSGKGTGNLEHLSGMDKLAIILQADGSLQRECDNHNYWTVSFYKEKKKNAFKKIVEQFGLEVKEIKPGRTDGRIRYSVKTPKDITKKLSSHFNLENMSYTYAHEFIEELMNWDGYIRNHNGKNYLYYSCVDKDNVDFCQAVGILGGYKSRSSIEVDNRKETFNDVHRLYLEETYYGTKNQTVTKSEYEYTGKIYCVKVPSHKIIIRRDGFELVTGNCHMLSSSAWAALLKCLEDCPSKTIFFLCTTERNKVPETIRNRAQCFNLAPISQQGIKNRLEKICQEEGFINYERACDFISKLTKGGMREAISYLEQCASYSTDLSLENVKKVLGGLSYETMFKLTWALQQKNEKDIISLVDSLYNEGQDLKTFISTYIRFVLDLVKFIIFRDIDVTEIPSYLAAENNAVVQYTVKDENSAEFLNKLLESLFALSQTIKNDTDYKTTIEILLLKFIRS